MNSLPRVYELARRLGITSQELLSRLQELSTDSPTSPSASVPLDLVEAITSNEADDSGEQPLDEGRRLIEAAFDVARRSGREEWQRMTVAVLKNRILTLTGHRFNEARWGVDSFREFIELFPDKIALDRSTRPATAEFVADTAAVSSVANPGEQRQSAQPTGMPRVTGPDRRIRPDLWRAVLDYSSGDIYLWDQGRAIGVTRDQVNENDDRPRVPTIDESVLTTWRREFLGKLARPEGGAAHQELARWAEERLSDAVLPQELRKRWNGELKRRILSHLDDWLAASKIPPPPDVVQTPDEKPSDAPSTEQLRVLVLRVVRAMTRAELEELRLPASALLRARR